MHIYITYDRYEGDEQFVLYSVETNERKAIKRCKKSDMIDFIAMCPDDCHSFQLQNVEMSRKEYLQLKGMTEGNETMTADELHAMLKNIFNANGYTIIETIVELNGNDDFEEIIKNYCKKHKLDPDCGSDYDKAHNALMNDEELLKKMIKQHIAKEHKIDRGPLDVFITYDRYEHDEWHSIYHIDTDEDSARQHFVDKDLLDFISYGPDDCHSFQLQKVRMTRAGYKWLCEENGKSSESKELEEFLTELYQGEYGDEVLMYTDGCSDNCEIIEFYCNKLGIDPDDDDAKYEAQNKLFDDDKLYEEIAREYIAANY